MSNSRIHIDQLFAKGLENLEIPIASNAFETIRKDIVSDTTESATNTKPFDNFELEVTDTDWQIIKERLAKAMANDPVNKVQSSLQELELAVTDNDWHNLKDRLTQETVKPIIPLPVNDIQSSFKDFEIAVTDADWQATKNKLNNFSKKKLVWWWWLNIAILGSLIGLALNHFEPMKTASSAISKSVITPLEAGSGGTSNGFNNIKESSVAKQNPTDNNIQYNSIAKRNAQANVIDPTEMPSSGSKQTFSPNAKKIKQHIDGYSTKEFAQPTPAAEQPIKDISDFDIKNNITVQNTETIENKDVVSAKNNEVPPTDLSDNINKTESTPVKDNPVIDNNQNIEPVNTKASAIDTPKKTNLTTPIIPPPLPKPNMNLYVGLTTDLAMTYRHLSKDNDVYYNRVRNNAEKPITQLSYGVTAGISKGKNQFQTGFQLTQQNFVTNYNYTYSIYDSIALYGPPPNHVFKGYFLFKKRDTTVKTQETVTIKKIDIPFNYSRTWTLDSKTQLITGFGAVMSFNTKAEGTKALNPVNSQLYFYHFQKNHEQNIGVSPSVNIGLQRSLGQNLMLQGNVFGKYSITNRYDASYPAKEYLYSYGLSIKLLYLLH